MAKFIANHSSLAGAEALAAAIETWWRRNGYPGVKCRIERVVDPKVKATGEFWAIRSNLHNGLPPPDMVCPTCNREIEPGAYGGLLAGEVGAGS